MIATLTDQRHLPGLSRRPGTLPDHISPSAAKSYLGCSLQFYFERVARIRKNTSVALHLGKAVHAALQVFHLARWRGGNDSPEAIDAAYGKAYLTKNAQALELVPLSASSGISMVVVPVGDPARPSKVFVIEVAQSIRLEGGATSKAGGVLVYSVDATLASGQNSVVVYPRAGIDEAPYQAGDAFNHADAPFRMQVLKSLVGDSYTLDIQLKD